MRLHKIIDRYLTNPSASQDLKAKFQAYTSQDQIEYFKTWTKSESLHNLRDKIDKDIAAKNSFGEGLKQFFVSLEVLLLGFTAVVSSTWIIESN